MVGAEIRREHVSAAPRKKEKLEDWLGTLRCSRRIEGPVCPVFAANRGRHGYGCVNYIRFAGKAGSYRSPLRVAQIGAAPDRAQSEFGALTGRLRFCRRARRAGGKPTGTPERAADQQKGPRSGGYILATSPRLCDLAQAYSKILITPPVKTTRHTGTSSGHIDESSGHIGTSSGHADN